jgi:hypothetical protein
VIKLSFGDYTLFGENQFKSCTKRELEGCLRSRLKLIREINRFLKDDASKQYFHISLDCSLRKIIIKKECEYIVRKLREFKRW